jgi:hypothetical protein
MDIFDAVYFYPIAIYLLKSMIFEVSRKRKQALLGSNLSGIP